MRRLLAMTAVLLGACACSDKSPGAGECAANSDCAAGSACEGGTCKKLCLAQADCAVGEVCTPQGTCSTPGVGAAPAISAVLGNAAADALKITDGLIVQGVNLGQAAFELRGNGGPWPLLVRAASSQQAEVVLPEDVRSGAYDLVATNLAGSAQAAVTLTLPELTGDILLDRINSEATGTVAFARLPVGAGSQQVAVGDHGHSQAELAAALASGPITATSGTFSGPVKIGDSSATCTAALQGSLRFASAALQLCTSAGWITVQPTRDGTTALRAARSCQALLTDYASTTSGVYWLDPQGQGNAFQAYCDMTTNGGGWTLVANIAPNDSNSVGYGNEDFWTKARSYGTLVDRFASDYKSPAAYRLEGTHLLIQSAAAGSAGAGLGWRRWPLSGGPRTFSSLFDPVGLAYAWGGPSHWDCDTGVADAVDVGTTNGSDAIIRQGTCLRADVAMAPGSAWPDMTRLTTLTGTTDDQMGGFGTFINGYASWNPAAPYMGLDHAGCAAGTCAYTAICRVGSDCAGNYCASTYPATLCGSVWNSRFYVR